jgi:hypothetical protein
MEAKQPPIPRQQQTTLRRQILDLLAERPLTAREISMAVGIAEKQVLPHLEHIRRSLHRHHRTLKVIPPLCRQCGFAFHKRERLTRPSRCPVCRSEAIDPPRFTLDRA